MIFHTWIDFPRVLQLAPNRVQNEVILRDSFLKPSFNIKLYKIINNVRFFILAGALNFTFLSTEYSLLPRLWVAVGGSGFGFGRGFGR